MYACEKQLEQLIFLTALQQNTVTWKTKEETWPNMASGCYCEFMLRFKQYKKKHKYCKRQILKKETKF